MSFQGMREALDAAYERNVYVARARLLVRDGHDLIGEAPGRRRIPALSGPTGIGKTACIEQFAEAKGFELVRLDCTYMPVSLLAIRMREACKRIAAEEIAGCVLLVDNVDQADEEWREIFLQYARGHLDTVVEAMDARAGGATRRVRVRVDDVPETLFVVGEARDDA